MKPNRVVANSGVQAFSGGSSGAFGLTISGEIWRAWTLLDSHMSLKRRVLTVSGSYWRKCREDLKGRIRLSLAPLKTSARTGNIMVICRLMSPHFFLAHTNQEDIRGVVEIQNIMRLQTLRSANHY